MTIEIRITARNNSDCRDGRFGALSGIRGASVKHNGGKTMIAHVHSDDLDRAKAALEESHQVSSYEIKVQ